MSNIIEPDAEGAEALAKGALRETARIAGHRSLAAYEHELALMHERQDFGLATSAEVGDIENRLVLTWRDLISASMIDMESATLTMEVIDGTRH